MKERNNLFIGVFLGIMICGAFVFLFLLFKMNDFSFFHVSIIGIVSILLVLLFIKTPIANRFTPIKNIVMSNITFTSRRLLTPVLIVLAGLVVCSFLFEQNKWHKTQSQLLENSMEQRSTLIESIRQNNLISISGNVMDKVEEELRNTPNRTLSKETIERIALLNQSLKPYEYLKQDSLLGKKFSQERGLLLLTLCKMDIDSTSFNLLKMKTSFAGADLRGADLRGADLNKIDLTNANLHEADLREANLNKAILSGAIIWGGNLKRADLSGAILIRTDLRWANLNEADLRKANMEGADLTAAKLKKANLEKANLKWAYLSYVSLNEADMNEADLLGVDLHKANLYKTNLSGANLTWTNLSDANLSGTDLTNVELSRAAVRKDGWLKKLKGWQVKGASEIEKKYKTVSNVSIKSVYQINKK